MNEVKIENLNLSTWNPEWLSGKECLQCRRRGFDRSLGQEDPLEKKMATHYSTLAWEIPWTE